MIRRAALIAAGLAVAVHVAEAARVLFLPADAPLFNDFALLQYTAGAAREFHAESGTLWGYDPHFMAGYPLTFIWNSNVLTQLLAVIFPAAPVPALLRAFLFASLAAAPLLFFLALRNFGFSPRRALAGAAICLIYFRLGAPALFHLTGMVTAGLSTTFNIFAVSLVFAYLRRRRARTRQAAPALLAALVAVALAPLIHKTAVVVLVPPLIILLAQNARRLNAKEWAAAAAAAALTFAVNSFWLMPLFRFLPYKTFLEDAPFWQNTDPLRPVLDFLTPAAQMNNLTFGGVFGAAHSALLLGILLLGVRGLVLWKRERPDLFPAFAATSAFLFLLSYYGSFWRPAAELNPTRYLPTLHLFLIIPAIAAVTGFASAPQKNPLAPALSAALLAAFVALFAYSILWLQPFYRLLAIQPPVAVRQLTEWLRHADPGGRVLLEDSGVLDRNGPGQSYGMTHLPALLPERTGREFIGGPYPYVFLRHRFAGFHDGRLFGKDITDHTIEDLREYLRIYNVRRIACWSHPSRLVFDYHKKYFQYKESFGSLAVYEFAGWEPGALPLGTASLKAGRNRIEASNVRPGNGAVILPYHWAPGIRANPPLTIKKQKLLADPVPFIKIENPPGEFTLKIK